MSASVFSFAPLGVVGACVFLALLAAAVASDVRTRRIPNRIVALLALAGVVFSVAARGVEGGLVAGLTGLGAGLVLWLPLFVIGAMGAGDVKLFAAAGAWLGPERALVGALLAALVGGALGVVWLLRTHGVARGRARFATALRPSARRGVDTSSSRPLPYGVAMALGAAGAAWLPRFISGGG